MASTTATRFSFFQSRLGASPTGPVITRTAQPAIPRPLSNSATAYTSSPSAIVLAWDNVIFPTNWMFECAGLRGTSTKNVEESKRVCLANPFIGQALLAIESQVIDLLARTTTKTPVFILTDHTSSTIEQLCAAFYPRLQSCLAQASGSGRVHIMAATSAALTQTERVARKLSVLQQICQATMAQQTTRAAAITGRTPFMVLTVSADELELRAAARMQELVASAGSIQSLSLPATTGTASKPLPLPLVDFHRQLQSVTAALASQCQ